MLTSCLTCDKHIHYRWDVSGCERGPECDKHHSSRSKHKTDTSEDEDDTDDMYDRSLSLPGTNQNTHSTEFHFTNLQLSWANCGLGHMKMTRRYFTKSLDGTSLILTLSLIHI